MEPSELGDLLSALVLTQDQTLADEIESPPSQAIDSTSEIIEDLAKISKKNPKLVRSTTHVVQSKKGPRSIRSWKMNEFKYTAQPSPFPTLARGLFTESLLARGKQGSQDDAQDDVSKTGTHRVVARGYDKFFNIGEVGWTSWDALEKNTEPPYVLTLKSNGCIIFMSALSPTELIVMSKHSLGALEGMEVSHAQMGEIWLGRHLEAKGKTKEELAKTLWRENLTAVAELCDDSFEEHVLPYPPELTGLHLHGLNRNVGDFVTLDTPTVDAFADEWGFIKTASLSLSSTIEVKDFTDEIGKTGKWNGQAVEGFVVRTKVATRHDRQATPRPTLDSPPYSPGSNFFFKIKFDEPYMTYRDWREITKIILSKQAKSGSTIFSTLNSIVIPKSKLRRPESHLYQRWVEREIIQNPRMFKGFSQGKGIINVRDKFLHWMEEGEGKKELEREETGKGRRLTIQYLVGWEEEEQVQKKWKRVCIVPVAVPGSGKTAIGVALSHLFGFGHTQSDDVTTKRSGPTFIKNICDLFEHHDVVFADRNNHLEDHRKAIKEAVKRLKKRTPPVKLLALYWPLQGLPVPTIHRICSDRIVSRGSNHQTLRFNPVEASDDPDSETRLLHEEVIWSFISSSQELGSAEVDNVLEMSLEDTLEEAVARVVTHLVSLVEGIQDPGPGKIKEACEKARSYRTSITKETGGYIKAASLAKPPRYFGILAEIDIKEIVSSVLEGGTDEPSEKAPNDEILQDLKLFWDHLERKNRVAPRPHITIVHGKSLPAEQPLWDRCVALQQPTQPPPIFKFSLSNIVFDGKVMGFTVEDLHVAENAVKTPGADGWGDNDAGKVFLNKLPQELKSRLHITVGTESDATQAFQAGTLIEGWKSGKLGEEEVKVIPLRATFGQGRLKGLF